jgi:hypothetical protein
LAFSRTTAFGLSRPSAISQLVVASLFSFITVPIVSLPQTASSSKSTTFYEQKCSILLTDSSWLSIQL